MSGSMVADETKTAPSGIAAAAPCSANSTASVWGSWTTTTEMTMWAPTTACAGVDAPRPPAATNRSTAAGAHVAATDLEATTHEGERDAQTHRAEADNGRTGPSGLVSTNRHRSILPLNESGRLGEDRRWAELDCIAPSRRN